ncbi:MAG: hypothetical protein M3325_15580 [Actinomycetota bacterium]|nr:hypothetical protein [Actinomycetota bacterium]
MERQQRPDLLFGSISPRNLEQPPSEAGFVAVTGRANCPGDHGAEQAAVLVSTRHTNRSVG